MKNMVYMFVAVSIAGMMSVLSAQAATDYYLKIDDIKGESTSQESSVGTEVRAERTYKVSSEAVVETGSAPVDTIIEIDTTRDIDAQNTEAQVETTDENTRADKATPLLFESANKGKADTEGNPDRPVVTDELPSVAGIYIKLGDIKGEVDDASNKQQKDAQNIDTTMRSDKIASHTTLTVDSEIRVSGVEVRGWNPVTKRTVTDAITSEPRTVTELAILAATTAERDANMENISFNYGKIEWEYKTQGKFFGFITVPYTETIEVKTQEEGMNRVNVRLPWFTLLMKKPLSARTLEADLATSISGEGDLALQSQQTESVEVDVIARTFIAISNTLKTRHDTAMSSIRNIK